MGYKEKINIYIPQELKNRIDADAMLFEVLKKDNRTVNVNKFLSLLLCGYYDNYQLEKANRFDTILSFLRETSLSDNERIALSNRILNEIILPTDNSIKGKNSVSLSLKPTNETERIIISVENELKGRDTVSHYIRRMIMSYFQKPIFEREQIIFQDKYLFINDMCSRQSPITFSLIWEKDKQHEVIPYRIATGTDGMFNYLICIENNLYSGKQEVRSYRLNRITSLGYGRNILQICNELRALCERTVETAPQYAINNYDEICVKLNDIGEKLYNRIYYGRPKYNRIEDLEEGHYYYFNCSTAQIFHYFRRFDNGTAIIISPASLVEKMKEFHQKAFSAYR